MSARGRELAEHLRDADVEVRRRAARELGTVTGPEACDLLLVALGDEDWRVRKEAAAIAPNVTPRTAVVFAVARSLAEHENVGLRNSAVEALVRIGPDAVPGAIDALGRLDADGRKLAVEVLAGAPTLAGMRSLARALPNEPDGNVVLAMAEALGDAVLAGEEARDVALEALGRLVAPAPAPAQPVAVMLAALSSLRRLQAVVPWAVLEPLVDDPLLRRSALEACAGNLSPRALRALAEGVLDPHASIAHAALVALGESLEAAWDDDALLETVARTLRTSPVARRRLARFARDTSDRLARGAAILALGLVRDPEDLSLLADALSDPDVAEHVEAAIERYGDVAIDPLLSAGRSFAPPARGATLSVIPTLVGSSPDSERSRAIRDALEDPSPDVVAPALKTLSLVGDASDLPRVARHVQSAEPKVSAAAQAAFVALASRHPREARAFVGGPPSGPRGEGALVVVLALNALSQAGDRDPSDGAFLSAALTHSQASVRRAALDALAEHGGEAAARAVSIALADEDSAVALAAIRALGKLGRGEELASLAAKTRDPLRLGSVLAALAEADPARAFAAARPLASSSDAELAAVAVDVIGSTQLEGHEDGRVEALMIAALHGDQEVVKLALGRLATFADERALAALSAGLEHDAPAVRRHAAELIGATGGSEGEALLVARLEREPDPDVRGAIMSALRSRAPFGGEEERGARP